MVYKFLLRQVIFSFRILINGGPKTNILIGTCQNNSTFVFFLNTQTSITTFSMLGGYQYIGIFGGTPLKSHHNKTLYTFSSLYFFYFILNTAKICTKIFCAKVIDIHTLDILFPSNHNIHKSLCDLCFQASDLLIDRFQ